jgi:hypothetical protein
MARAEEAKVLMGIEQDMKSLPRTPSLPKIEKEYDDRSEAELATCGKLASFVRKVKEFQHKAKGAVWRGWKLIKDASCMGSSTNAPQQAPGDIPCLDTLSLGGTGQKKPVSAYEAARNWFMSALAKNIHQTNKDISKYIPDTLLPTTQVNDLAKKLEERLLQELGQMYGNADAPMSQSKKIALYQQQGLKYITQMKDMWVFHETVEAYKAMRP